MNAAAAKTKKPAAKKADVAQAEPTVIAIKGFDKDMKCRGFQFQVGKTYEQPGNIEVCSNGFHAVAGSPFDVWNHYPLIADDGSINRWAEVTLSGATSAKNEPNDSKIAAAKISVNVELHLPALIRRGIDWLIANTKGGDTAASGHSSKLAASGHSSQLAASGDYSQLAASGHSSQLAASGHYSKLAASGDYSQLAASGHSSQLAASGHYSQLAASGDYSKLAASGDSSQLAASGHYSKLAASGHYSKLAASGDSSKLAASGHYSQLAASGDYSKLAASGDYSKLAASGHSSQLAASGDYSKLAASGHYSKLAASGDSSVIASSGIGTTAKGVIGTWISLAEFNRDGKCVGFATGCIGQDGLEPNVSYVAKGGKLIPS